MTFVLTETRPRKGAKILDYVAKGTKFQRATIARCAKPCYLVEVDACNIAQQWRVLS